MSELVDKLLQPISADAPCGPDMSYDPSFDELQTILKGKPEVEIGSVVKPAEPPDWRELQKKSTEFLGKSKHLNVAVMLTCSLLRTQGFSGFVQGMQLLRGLLENFWAPLHPILDPDDNNDPTQRLNLLSAITTPRGSVMGGWLTIVDYLYAAPICRPQGVPPVTFDDVIAARKKTADPESLPPEVPDFAKVSAMIASAGGEAIAACHGSIQEAREALQGIDQFLENTLGAGNSINFETLGDALTEIDNGIASFLPGAAAEGAEATGEGAAAGGLAAGGTAGAARISISGSIGSREDVVRTIDSICEYYRQVEPSSPVPFVLRRAQKMAMMNFVEAVEELSLGNLDSLRPSMGSALDSLVPPSE